MADDVAKSKTAEVAAHEEHYEEVAEYRVGEGAPPLALVVLFALIVTWAATSWVPFFGY
ncbi:MAG: hypothetical protein K2W95_01700 [Candidatus Obscuribacterales bacterium]|nr:hypothetical protein [Candidatus Obscuribacterales bacterium]